MKARIHDEAEKNKGLKEIPFEPNTVLLTDIYKKAKFEYEVSNPRVATEIKQAIRDLATESNAYLWELKFIATE